MKSNTSRSNPDSAPVAAAPAKSDKAPVWRQDDGAPVSCLEKIKVLNENYSELRQMAQDALEDALLMGCSEVQMRGALREMVDSLVNPYGKAPPATKDEA